MRKVMALVVVAVLVAVLAGQALSQTVKPLRELRIDRYPTAVALPSDDSKRAYVGTDDGEFIIFSLTRVRRDHTHQRELLKSFPAHSRPIRCIAFAQVDDIGLLVSGGLDRVVRVWQIDGFPGTEER